MRGLFADTARDPHVATRRAFHFAMRPHQNWIIKQKGEHAYLGKCRRKGAACELRTAWPLRPCTGPCRQAAKLLGTCSMLGAHVHSTVTARASSSTGGRTRHTIRRRQRRSTFCAALQPLQGPLGLREQHIDSKHWRGRVSTRAVIVVRVGRWLPTVGGRASQSSRWPARATTTSERHCRLARSEPMAGACHVPRRGEELQDGCEHAVQMGWTIHKAGASARHIPNPDRSMGHGWASSSPMGPSTQAGWAEHADRLGRPVHMASTTLQHGLQHRVLTRSDPRPPDDAPSPTQMRIGGTEAERHALYRGRLGEGCSARHIVRARCRLPAALRCC
jgi:hypothetical protein